jgi:hypothetical protein
MRPKAFKENQMLLVTFYDIISDDEWQTKEKAKLLKLPECKIMGYFFSQDKVTLKVTPFVGDKKAMDDDLAYIVAIPWGCVLKIEELRKV